MTSFRLGPISVATAVAFSFSFADVARAAEPPETAEPAVTDTAPPEPSLSAPAPPPAPAPLLMRPPSDGAGAPAVPAAVDPDAKALRAADPRFGDAGQVALNGTLSASIGHLGYDNGDSSSTSVSVEPAFDYFSASNFSEGATAFFHYGASTSPSGVEGRSTTVGVTGRIGPNFWLGGRFSFWPKLGVGAWRNWLTYSAPTPGYTVTIDGVVFPIGPSSHFKEDAVFIEVQAPFLFHLARHFFVGFGPNAYVDVLHSVDSAKNRRRFVGAASTVGGWF